MPIATSKKKDKISEAIAETGLTMGQPSWKMNGVDLREIKANEDKSAYSAYQDLIRDTKINGRNLRAALQSLVSSRKFQKAPSESSIEGEDSLRASLVRSVISRYRTQAKKQLIKQIPELKNKIELKKDLRRQVRKGKTTARDAVLQLINRK